jgi:hypothetical protein
MRFPQCTVFGQLTAPGSRSSLALASISHWLPADGKELSVDLLPPIWNQKEGTVLDAVI